MVRTFVTPTQQYISIAVPQDYVGRKIEVLLYAVDEPVGEERTAAPNNNAAQFKGIFSREEGKKINEYQKQAREEWDRDI